MESAQDDGGAAPSRARLDAAMDRYADGDDGAFATLYEELAPRLYGFARRETGSGSAAEDVVQQALLQIHGARGRFVRGAAVLPWAYAIARRLLIDGHRRALHEVRLESVEDETAALERPEERPSPEEELDRRRRDGELRRDLAALPDSLREAFQLVRLEGLTVAEAAEALGITPGMVKTRAYRAGLALRAGDARRRRSP